MYFQYLRGLRQVATVILQDLPDKVFFKLAHCLCVEDSAFNQLVNEGFKLVFHDNSLIPKASPWRSISALPKFLL